MRLRITFSKTHAMRYTGHLDLHKAWERAIRRACLPLAYSQGFNPHPRIQLASALPLGFTSQAELVDIWLETELPLQEIATRLNVALPPGIRLESLAVIQERLPALQTQVAAADFEVTLLEPQADLEAHLLDLLNHASLPRERRGKTYDLRPLILELQQLPPQNGCQRLSMRLVAREGATGRPEEVLAVLGIPAEAARLHRTRILFAPLSSTV